MFESQIYRVKSCAPVNSDTILDDPNYSKMSVAFDSDNDGPFAVISFRVSLKNLKAAVRSSTRYFAVLSGELRSLLRGIIQNEAEGPEIRMWAKTVLNDGGK
jgi:hypothetical protein